MSDPLSAVITALKADSIIPDVIPADVKFTPSVLFSIVWPDHGEESMLGNIIKQKHMLEEPQLKITSFAPADSNSGKEPTYTLIMTDPDAPTRSDPIWGEFRHWVLPGLSFPSSGIADTKTEHPIASYCPPGPPPGTGLHRYVFLLFEEPSAGLSVPQDAVERGTVIQGRRSWNAMEFASKYGLKLVGANFISAEHQA